MQIGNEDDSLRRRLVQLTHPSLEVSTRNL